MDEGWQLLAEEILDVGDLREFRVAQPESKEKVHGAVGDDPKSSALAYHLYGV